MINVMQTPAAEDHSPPSTTRRIGLVDDHDVVRIGLKYVIDASGDLELVASARSVRELLAQTDQLDLVLLDLSLDDGSEPEDNVRLLAQAGIPALAYTSGDNPYLIRSAARGGVRGVIRKSLTHDVMLAKIRSAIADAADVIGTEWAAAVDADSEFGGIHLSPRQREVLELFASGESAKRVAHRTGLAQTTVTDYLLRIRAKYAEQGRDASTKIALYQRALEDGVLPPPSAGPTS